MNNGFLITIGVCSYNPQQYYFERVLNSIKNISLGDYSLELLIIDNFSSPSIQDLSYVKEILKEIPNHRVVIEERRGTAYARCRAIVEAKGDYFLFVDDDSVIDQNYIINAIPLFDKYPSVALWGSSSIEIEFLESVPKWVHNFKLLFHERNFPYLEYACINGWDYAFPVGMGMVFRPKDLLPYTKRVFSGEFTIKGRDGKSLVTNEDTQMIWFMTQQGYAAGSSPDLKLKHLIPAKRTTMKYLARLNYGISVVLAKTNAEVYTDKLESLRKSPPRTIRILKMIAKLAFSNFIELQFRRFYIDFAFELGIVNGRYRLAGIHQNMWIRLAQALNFE